MFSILFGVPLGVISAVKQDTKLDYALRVLSLGGLSMPAFWLGLLILMVFVATMGTIPIYSDAPKSFWDSLVMYSFRRRASAAQLSLSMRRPAPRRWKCCGR